VNASPEKLNTAIDLKGVASVATSAKLTILASDQPTDENSLAQPKQVAPVDTALAIPGPTFRHSFPGNSVTVLRVPLK
jgi:alpha-L-arabinofuranosidase